MKIKSEQLRDEYRCINIMRASDESIEDVSIMKEPTGEISLFLSGNDDFYCNNTVEEMDALQKRIVKAIEISKNFDYYFDYYK